MAAINNMSKLFVILMGIAGFGSNLIENSFNFMIDETDKTTEELKTLFAQRTEFMKSLTIITAILCNYNDNKTTGDNSAYFLDSEERFLIQSEINLQTVRH